MKALLLSNTILVVRIEMGKGRKALPHFSISMFVAANTGILSHKVLWQAGPKLSTLAGG